MSVVVRVAGADGVRSIVPAGAPSVLAGEPGVDVAVLDVLGGQLSWSVLAEPSLPAAVIDDPARAQDWVWAVYGEPAALALADTADGAVAVEAEPALPELAARIWRLGLAHWAARWWPASGIDGIAGLDDALLRADIADLSAECELLLADSDVEPPAADTPTPAGTRAEYALAAGGAGETDSGGVVLARGTGGWDWRRCPPGLVDASEQAVAWTLVRAGGATAARVSAVAAPGLAPAVAPHLRPHALVRGDAGSAAAKLELRGDTWVGSVAAESVLAVDIYVPGVGPAGGADDAAADTRRRVREFAADRLRRARGDGAPGDVPLAAETAAAADDSDF